MADTGLAVALDYDPARPEPPRVSAKGQGPSGGQIIAVAEANGVPVRRARDLAQVLAALEVDAPIPVAAFASVAEILARIYRANGRLAQAAAGREANR
jgi:flagellar biosynthesis protein